MKNSHLKVRLKCREQRYNVKAQLEGKFMESKAYSQYIFLQS